MVVSAVRVFTRGRLLQEIYIYVHIIVYMCVCVCKKCMHSYLVTCSFFLQSMLYDYFLRT